MFKPKFLLLILLASVPLVGIARIMHMSEIKPSPTILPGTPAAATALKIWQSGESKDFYHTLTVPAGRYVLILKTMESGKTPVAVYFEPHFQGVSPIIELNHEDHTNIGRINIGLQPIDKSKSMESQLKLLVKVGNGGRIAHSGSYQLELVPLPAYVVTGKLGSTHLILAREASVIKRHTWQAGDNQVFEHRVALPRKSYQLKVQTDTSDPVRVSLSRYAEPIMVLNQQAHGKTHSIDFVVDSDEYTGENEYVNFVVQVGGKGKAIQSGSYELKLTPYIEPPKPKATKGDGVILN